jgi:acetyl esterase
MPVHPELQMLLDLVAAAGASAPPLSETTPEMSRMTYQGLAMMAGPGPEVGSVEDRTIPGSAGDIPVRVYRPFGEGPFGVTMFFHGGGFVIGDLDTHDNVCRELCAGAGVMVVAVHYRLAPEARFPAAVEDCWEATKWVAAHGAELGADPGRLAVVGDSAGGNLSAVIALLAREHGGPAIRFQGLVYPTVDGDGEGWPSRVENAEGYLLTAEQMQWFMDHYSPDPSLRRDWRAAPLRAASHADLPEALVITAEFDPLRDEGAAYAKALASAGVAVTHTNYEGAIHIFFQLPGTQLGRQAIDEMAAALKRTIG